MSDFADGYQPDGNYNTGNGPRLEAGDYKVRIEEVSEGYSKAGNRMITVILGIAQADFKLKHFLVKGEYFNQNMTKFFDCFKIPRGNFEFNRWCGRVGKAYLDYGEKNQNGKSYMELKYLIVPEGEPVQAPPKAPAPPPQKQGPAAQPAPAGDDFTDDIQF